MKVNSSFLPSKELALSKTPLPQTEASPRPTPALQLSEEAQAPAGNQASSELLAGLDSTFPSPGADVQDRLYDSPGSSKPNAQEEALLRKSLNTFEPGVLKLLEKEGWKIGVVRPGQDFADLGLVKPRSAEFYQEQLPAQKEAAQEYRQAVAPLDQKLAQLNQQIETIQGPFRPDAPPLPADKQAQVDGLRREMGGLKNQKVMAQATTLGDLSLHPFEAITPTGEDPILGKATPQMASTLDMAKLSGATTKEQIQEYTGLVEAINGEQLDKARQAALEKLGPEERAKAFKDPSKIAVDHEAFQLLTPDLYYQPDGKGAAQRLGYDDAYFTRRFAGEDGTVSADEDKFRTLRGVAFYDSQRILIGQSSLTGNTAFPLESGDTAIHEVGHAVDQVVKQRDPDFHADWSKRTLEQFKAAKKNEQLITDYAGTLPQEYVAEGVSHYLSDPDQLKNKDPALYQLTKELLDRANQLGQN